MKCQACGKEGSKKEFLFDENKLSYCANPFTCNEYHPNSVANIIKRGAAVKMFTEDEFEMSFFDMNGIGEEMKERVLKIATKPQSIRLSKYDIAYYLLQLQETRELSSISEAVRYCVLYTKKNLGLDKVNQDDIDVPQDESSDVEFVSNDSESVKDEPQVIEKSKGVKIVVPDMPKSINVDWSQVDVSKAKVVPAEPEDEDEFTF